MKINQQKKRPIFNPFEQITDQRNTSSNAPEKLAGQSEQIKKQGDFSPMNFGKLEDIYKDQDSGALDKARESLSPDAQKEYEKLQFHRRFNREEEEYYLKRKREEEEKKIEEEKYLLERNKQQELEKHNAQLGEMPKGKEKKNIFGKTARKADTGLPPEIKPGGGKQ